MADLIGKTLGQYQILREIGRGGMAIVYEAYQPSLRRAVAIKVLPAQYTFDATFVKRFQQEARASARLNHPNIVSTYDVGEHDGVYYIVMEKVEGESLQSLIRRTGRLPLSRTTYILRQIASALDYAHAHGIVHRDIKPANIIVGAGDRATLTDFGIAKAVEGTRMTQSGMLIGTPEYMSPEQARGEGVGKASDIYALGVTVYEMLTGRVPFRAESPIVVLHKHGYETPPPVRSSAADLPASIERVMAKALAKSPNQRYRSAAEMAVAVAEIGHSVDTGKGKAGTGRWASLAWIAGMLLIGILVLGTWLVLTANVPNPMVSAGGAAPTSTPARPATSTLAPTYMLVRPATSTVDASSLRTNIPTRMATSTTAPIPTHIPRPASTIAPAPATPIRRIPTPTTRPKPSQPAPTPTPIPTLGPASAAPAPVLTGPENGLSASGSQSVTFAWTWPSPALEPEQGFEVRVWKEGQPDHYGAADPVNCCQTSINLSGAYGVQQGGDGEYLWTVAVVQRNPYQRIGTEAPARRLNYSGGGDSGGGGGSPTPRPP